MPKRKTIAVVGGGSAGFTAARTASKLGARVLFFMGERSDRASLCVNYGCMPSKAFFEPIDSMHHARRHGWLSVEPKRPEAYLSQIVKWKDREIARFRAYRQSAISGKDSKDFQVIRASARFLDPHTLEAAGEKHRADAIILATGSVVTDPPLPGLPQVREEVWSNEEILANTTLPESLTVIGAGAIGVEFALRYARLGCHVTILARSCLLSHFPKVFSERLKKAYEKEGIRVLCESQVAGMKRDFNGWFVVQTEGPAGSEPISSERVLLATGRRPALASLALEKAGIDLQGNHSLEVGEDMRVAGHPHIFAAGDVSGKRLVVHQAHIEAGIAAENAITGGSRQWSRRANLQVVFSDPEFAYAGMNATQAESSGHRVMSASKEARLVGKHHLGGDDFGIGELIADADHHQLLGAGLLCRGASDLIHLPAYFIEHQHTIQQAAEAEYYHPTRAEIISGILDRLCQQIGTNPFCRADE